MFKKANDVCNPIFFILIGILTLLGVVFAILSSISYMSHNSETEFDEFVDTQDIIDTTFSLQTEPIVSSSFITTSFVTESLITSNISNENVDIVLPVIDRESLIDLLYDNIKNVSNNVFLPYDVSTDDIVCALDIIYHKNLDEFWILDDWSGEFTADGVIVHFLFINSLNIDDIVKMKQSLSNKIYDIVEMANEYSTDYDKVKFVHDYLVDTVEYGQLPDAECDAFSHTAYGCLVENIAVCDGYAKAFALIMQKLGINSGVVFGTGDFESNLADHAWNYVELDNKYYWIDVTWDDYIASSESSASSYSYFLLSDSAFLKTHKIIGTDYNDYIPKCK